MSTTIHTLFEVLFKPLIGLYVVISFGFRLFLAFA